jgi:hypothetical protein
LIALMTQHGDGSMRRGAARPVMFTAHADCMRNAALKACHLHMTIAGSAKGHLIALVPKTAAMASPVQARALLLVALLLAATECTWAARAPDFTTTAARPRRALMQCEWRRRCRRLAAYCVVRRVSMLVLVTPVEPGVASAVYSLGGGGVLLHLPIASRSIVQRPRCIVRLDTTTTCCAPNCAPLGSYPQQAPPHPMHFHASLRSQARA